MAAAARSTRPGAGAIRLRKFCQTPERFRLQRQAMASSPPESPARYAPRRPPSVPISLPICLPTTTSPTPCSRSWPSMSSTNSSVRRFERLEKIELDDDPGGRDIQHFHPTGPDLSGPRPAVHSAYALAGVFVGAGHGWIHFLPRRPLGPGVEIVELRDDLLGRRGDRGGALNPKMAWSHRGSHEHARDQNDDDEREDHEHQVLLPAFAVWPSHTRPMINLSPNAPSLWPQMSCRGD